MFILNTFKYERKDEYLEQNFSAHCFAVRDDGLFVAAFAVPTVQFDAPSRNVSSTLAITFAAELIIVHQITCILPAAFDGTFPPKTCHQTVFQTDTCCATS